MLELTEFCKVHETFTAKPDTSRYDAIFLKLAIKDYLAVASVTTQLPDEIRFEVTERATCTELKEGIQAGRGNQYKDRVIGNK